ncbi:hypothetical protein EV363DRAFT_1426736 [Boletus edulis]|nr:hypothetical protein EV363DRAFT_1426736 [Boletus edulis]
MVPQPIPIPSPRVVAASLSPSSRSPFLRHRDSLVALDAIRQPKVLHPADNEDLRLLILENISQEAVCYFRSQGFHVDHHTTAFSEAELLEKIPHYHAVGIRSKTRITEKIIKAATKLLVIGCFCIGTNQVDLITAAKAGIPVFNSPFSNSRSVAELVVSEIIALSRQWCQRSHEMHAGLWNKQSKGCWEVRGKTLGIVGYGHIGSQLSVLAEAFGMRVVFYDVINIMPLGSARQVETLSALLVEADFVSLHELEQMKEGSYLINNARGRVVDIPALIDALTSKHLAGAALDVYPAEPASNGPSFDDQINSWATTLRNIPNVILTPHIGGSTEEAQRMIGEEVSQAVTRYLNYGSTHGAVNFPEIDLRAITAEQGNNIRVCHVHSNQPGVLRQVNDVLSPYNVEKQYSDSKGDIAYLLADIADVSLRDVNKIREALSHTRTNILTRLLV